MSTKTATSGKLVPTKSSTPKTPSASHAGNPAHNGKCVCAEDIRLTAYQKWEAAGKPDSDGVTFWLEAEQELQTAQ